MKYQIILDTMCLALKYQTETRITTMGGNFRFQENMEYLLKKAFRNPNRQFQQTQQNKIRFVFRLDLKKFSKGLNWLRNHSYIVEQVGSLGTIMR